MWIWMASLHGKFAQNSHDNILHKNCINNKEDGDNLYSSALIVELPQEHKE